MLLGLRLFSINVSKIFPTGIIEERALIKQYMYNSQFVCVYANFVVIAREPNLDKQFMGIKSFPSVCCLFIFSINVYMYIGVNDIKYVVFVCILSVHLPVCVCVFVLFCLGDSLAQFICGSYEQKQKFFLLTFERNSHFHSFRYWPQLVMRTRNVAL